MNKIIAALKKNRNGSWFSVITTRDFGRNYAKNFLLEILTDTPVLKTFVKPLMKTLDDIDKEIGRLQSAMAAELTKELPADFPSLSYTPSEPLALSDETILDAEVAPVTAQGGDGQPCISDT